MGTLQTKEELLKTILNFTQLYESRQTFEEEFLFYFI